MDSTDARDGQIYKTVKIGTQTWMAENLNYIDDSVAKVYAENRICLDGNLIKCGYGYDCKITEQIKGICPDGWNAFEGVSQGKNRFGFTALPAGYYGAKEDSYGNVVYYSLKEIRLEAAFQATASVSGTRFAGGIAIWNDTERTYEKRTPRKKIRGCFFKRRSSPYGDQPH